MKTSVVNDGFRVRPDFNRLGSENEPTKVRLPKLPTPSFMPSCGINLSLRRKDWKLSYNGQGADKVRLYPDRSGRYRICGPEASVYVYNEGKEDHAVVFAQLTNGDGTFLMGREPIWISNGAISKARLHRRQERWYAGHCPPVCFKERINGR